MMSTSLVQLVRALTLKWLDMGEGKGSSKKNSVFDDDELLEIILKNHLIFFYQKLNCIRKYFNY